jgi:hypothetical protein
MHQQAELLPTDEEYLSHIFQQLHYAFASQHFVLSLHHEAYTFPQPLWRAGEQERFMQEDSQWFFLG